MKIYIVTLAKDERETFGVLTSKGRHKSQKIRCSPFIVGVFISFIHSFIHSFIFNFYHQCNNKKMSERSKKMRTEAEGS
jgi:hypothetical protein